jgi:branched-chain amino acid transport system substrate-binding protein
VRTIKTLGYRKVALLFQGDAFGTDVKAAFEKETAAQGVSVAGMQSFKPDVSDMNEAVAALMNLEADVIYLGTSGSSVMQFYEKYLAQPKRSRLVGMSVFDVDAVRQRFGKDIAGVGVSLVVPNPENNKLAISREFQQLAKNSNLNLTLRSMESFVAAKTITQGLRKTRGQPNSAALIKALRSEPKMDLGGYVLNLTDSNAAASSYIELAVLNAQGRLRQ